MEVVSKFIKIQNELNGHVGDRLAELENRGLSAVTRGQLARMGVGIAVLGMCGGNFDGWVLPGGVIFAWFGFDILGLIVMRWILSRHKEAGE